MGVTFDVPTPYCSILKVNAPCELPLDDQFGECGNSGTAAETARTYQVANRKDVVVEEPVALAVGYHCGDTQNSAIPLEGCAGVDAKSVMLMIALLMVVVLTGCRVPLLAANPVAITRRSLGIRVYRMTVVIVGMPILLPKKQRFWHEAMRPGWHSSFEHKTSTDVLAMVVLHMHRYAMPGNLLHCSTREYPVVVV